MNKTNLLLDAGIFAAFLIAMEPHLSGVAIHEWLSLALAATIVVHLLLHWKWIVGVGAKFFKKLWNTSRLKFGIDTLLFVDFVAIMLSGIMISRSALPVLGIQITQANVQWRLLHSLSADAGIWLVGLHFALNWDWVVTTVKRIVITPIARFVQTKRTLQPAPVSTLDSIDIRGEKTNA
jgi:hypothetical protein